VILLKHSSEIFLLLFYDYIRILKEKTPLFFLAENVSGILADKHDRAFTNILYQMKDAGYDVAYKLLNSKKFNVPQDRKRVIIIGYREDLGDIFDFPQEEDRILTLKDAIQDLHLIDSSLNILMLRMVIKWWVMRYL
jgi:DNA (cytosine-5)-methyltransferase 1